VTNLPSRVGDRYRCFILVREDGGYGGPYGTRWRPPAWRCEDCGYTLRGDMGGWMKARAADHHECGHAPCGYCGALLARRKDGSPRQHAHNHCPGKSGGHRIEREFVQHMTTREYA
jgi:hypothetical protein